MIRLIYFFSRNAALNERHRHIHSQRRYTTTTNSMICHLKTQPITLYTSAGRNLLKCFMTCRFKKTLISNCPTYIVYLPNPNISCNVFLILKLINEWNVNVEQRKRQNYKIFTDFTDLHMEFNEPRQNNV